MSKSSKAKAKRESLKEPGIYYMWCHLFSAAQLIDRDIHAASLNPQNLRRDEYLFPRDSQFAHCSTDYALGTYSSQQPPDRWLVSTLLCSASEMGRATSFDVEGREHQYDGAPLPAQAGFKGIYYRTIHHIKLTCFLFPGDIIFDTLIEMGRDTRQFITGSLRKDEEDVKRRIVRDLWISIADMLRSLGTRNRAAPSVTPAIAWSQRTAAEVESMEIVHGMGPWSRIFTGRVGAPDDNFASLATSHVPHSPLKVECSAVILILLMSREEVDAKLGMGK
ncbi:hypothetical protein C8J57DRAFT_1234209 [Mycena rebaudengoi]|nr:hypothetical protein C8J57DRAFT_1234209 [Mycena rebaudengoi]